MSDMGSDDPFVLLNIISKLQDISQDVCNRYWVSHIRRSRLPGGGNKLTRLMVHSLSRRSLSPTWYIIYEFTDFSEDRCVLTNDSTDLALLGSP